MYKASLRIVANYLNKKKTTPLMYNIMITLSIKETNKILCIFELI